MRTIKHKIRGASLQRIEELDHLGTPDWVPYTKAVGQMTAVEEAMAETLHFSGLLRSCSNFEYAQEGRIEDEDGNMHNIEDLLDEAAERLDQAHEEWLEARKHAVRHQKPANEHRETVRRALHTLSAHLTPADWYAIGEAAKLCAYAGLQLGTSAQAKAHGDKMERIEQTLDRIPGHYIADAADYITGADNENA